MCVASIGNPCLPNELQAKVFEKTLWLLHLSVLVFVSLTLPRREDQAGGKGSKACWLGGSARWGRVDTFQLAQVLLPVLACRMTRYRFGNVDDGVGMACLNGAEEGEGARWTPLDPPPLIVLGAAQALNCKAWLVAPFHYLCSKLTDTALSGMTDTHREPS